MRFPRAALAIGIALLALCALGQASFQPGFNRPPAAYSTASLPTCNANNNVGLTVWDSTQSIAKTCQGAGGWMQLTGWVTVFDCDFTTATKQAFATDTTYTVCGKTFTKWNSANEATHAFVDGGLYFLPASTGDYYQDTRTAPLLGVQLASLIPVALQRWTERVRIWTAVTSNNGAANSDEGLITLDNNVSGSGFNYVTLKNASLLSNGYTSSGVLNWYLQVQGPAVVHGTTPVSSVYTPLAVNSLNQNIGMLEAPAYGSAGNYVYYSGYYDGGTWPALFPSAPDPGMNARATYLSPNGAYDMTTWLQSSDAGTSIFSLGAHRSGSGTSLIVNYARVRVDVYLGQ